MKGKGLLRPLSLLLAVVVAAGSAAGAKVKAAGNFSTNLSELTGLNGSWNETASGLRGAYSGGDAFAMSKTEGSDFVYEAKVHRNSGSAFSLVFRSNASGSECYVANIDFNRKSARVFSFGKNGGDIGPEYPLKDLSQPDYNLRLEVIGESIRYFVNGELAVSVTDGRYSSGYFGLLIYNGDGVFQDVNQTPVNAGSLPELDDLYVNGQKDAFLYSKDESDFAGRVACSSKKISLVPVFNQDTEISVSAYNKTGTLMQDIELKSGVKSPDISVADGFTTVLLKLYAADYYITKTLKIRESDPIYGDLDNDAQVKREDIKLLRDIIFERVTPTDYQSVCGDLNCDGKITVADVVLLRGKIKEIPMDRKISLSDAASRLTDLSALSQPAFPGETCAESSAYNKSSKYNEKTGRYENWSANFDEGYDGERTADGGYVFADIKGAGSLVRIWSADPRQGHVKIYIDGKPEPVVDAPFISLFGAGEFPFNLKNLCYDSARGKNCYVPITFNESCRVVAYGDWGKFYQINYVKFGNAEVESFELPLTAESQMALQNADRALGGVETAGEKSGSFNTVTIDPGESAVLYNRSGAGAVTGINIGIDEDLEPGEDWDALSELAVSAFWDNEEKPSVWATLGGFFASSTGLSEYSSLPCGVKENGVMYSNWYMPHEDGGRIELKNDSDRAYKIRYLVESKSISQNEAESALRFHAKFVRAKDPPKGERWPDAQFLYTQGRGRFVGTSLHVYKQFGTGDPAYEPDWWWGEGDEKFFVDGEKFPSWFGTGCEDYFGYAWGTWNAFSRAYHSQPFTNGGMFGIGNRLNNRFHIIDSVPFEKSFDGNLEKYHRDGYANWAFTNFWYLEKGGKDPYSAVSLAERTEYFKKPYPQAQNDYEGEDLVILESTGMMKAETQDMSGYAGSWSGGSQFIFKAESDAAQVKFRINIPEDGEYNVKAAFTKAVDFGAAQHYIDGAKVGEAVDLYNPSVVNTGPLNLGKIKLSKGYHELAVRIDGKNASSSGYFYGLDKISFEKQ